jgi:hypothetical protein
MLFNGARSLRTLQFMVDDENMDSMRRLLEKSWNSESMGPIPTNAESAADSAAKSILEALDRKQIPLFFVDILLPQYDITQGDRLYDEVLAVEFCIALANRLEGKSVIVVKDQRTMDTVKRILDRREFGSSLSIGDERENGQDDNEAQSGSSGVTNEVEYFDDFADFGAAGSPSTNLDPSFGSSSSDNNLDLFRRQLMSSWESESISSDETQKDTKGVPPASTKSSVQRYRLASMMGSVDIKYGSDMMDKVAKAVSDNAQPKADEDTLIILSAISPQELIGIRGLVGKYKGEKKIVLVNCQLKPIPRELISAQTVYCILPLIARDKTIDRSSTDSGKLESDPPQPKIVVLKRYPRDWEVFVDIGDGFKLGATAPAGRYKKMPPMEWIAGAVKRYLQSMR